MGDTRTCTILIPAWGLNCGASGFSRNQNNRGLSGAYVTYIYWSLSVKRDAKDVAQHAKIVGAFVLHLFVGVWSAKTRKPPIWAPWLTTPGWYMRSGSPCISMTQLHSTSWIMKWYFGSRKKKMLWCTCMYKSLWQNTPVAVLWPMFAASSTLIHLPTCLLENCWGQKGQEINNV